MSDTDLYNIAVDTLAVICGLAVIAGALWVIHWFWWDAVRWPLVGWEWRAEHADRKQLERTRREIEDATAHVHDLWAEIPQARQWADESLPQMGPYEVLDSLAGEADEPESVADERWLGQLHAINQELHGNIITGQFGDLTRPMEQLTHYEVEAVIVRLGHADWLPAAA